MLSLAMFSFWYVYVATIAFEIGVNDLMTQVTSMEFFDILRGQKYSQGQINAPVHFFRLSYLGTYLVYTAVATILYFFGRIKKESEERITICLSWIVGIVLLFTVLRYGIEVDERCYLFMIVPALCTIVLSFSNQRIGRAALVILMVMVIVPHIPAHYGAECSDMVLTTELKGSEFFALRINPEDKYFYRFHPFVNYYNPDKVIVASRTFKSWVSPDISILDTVTYIVDSKQSHNCMMYSFDFDPIQDWLDTNGDNLNSIYDNGCFKIYQIHA
jgi:hypothetical protein